MARHGWTFLAFAALLAAPASASVGLRPAAPAPVVAEVVRPVPAVPFAGYPAIGDTVDVYAATATNTLTIVAEGEEVVDLDPVRLASGVVPAEWAHLGPVSVAVHRDCGTYVLSRRDDPGLVLAPGHHVDALVTWDDGGASRTRPVVTNAVVVEATDHAVLLRLPGDPAAAMSPAMRLALAQAKGRLAFLLHSGAPQKAPAQPALPCGGGG